MLGLVCHGWQQRDGGGTAADHHDTLAGVVEIIRPMLGVDHLALEAFNAFQLRGEALIVVEVAGGAEQPFGQHRFALARVCAFDFNRPQGLRAGPRCLNHLVLQADMAIDSVLGGGLAQVRQDIGRPGNRLLVRPRLELVAVGVHVRVGADAGIAEQVPRAAGDSARFQDDVRRARAIRLQVARNTDARQAGAYDEDIHMLCGRKVMYGHSVSPEWVEVPRGWGAFWLAALWSDPGFSGCAPNPRIAAIRRSCPKKRHPKVRIIGLQLTF